MPPAPRREPLAPEGSDPFGTAKTVAHLARALVPARHVGEGEVGHHRAGRAALVAVVEVIDVRGVEVHRLLTRRRPSVVKKALLARASDAMDVT